MRDLLTFRRMLTTLIVQTLFWASLIATVVIGVVLILYGIDGFAEAGINAEGFMEFAEGGGLTEFLLGILFLTAGPILVRIVCEMLILFFRMNETLTDIRNLLRVMPEAMTITQLESEPEPIREPAQQTLPQPIIITTGAANGSPDVEERVAAVRDEMNDKFSDLRYDLRETLQTIRYALTEEGMGRDKRQQA